MKRPWILVFSVLACLIPAVVAVVPSGATATGVTVDPNYGSTGGSQPLALAADPSGNVFSVNTNDTVTKITPAGVVTSAWAALPAGSSPYFLTTDGDGNVYTSNYANHSVTKFLADGTTAWTTVVSSNYVGGICVASDGSVYVAIYTNGGGVVKLSSSGVVDSSFNPSLPAGWTPWAMVLRGSSLYLSAYNNGDIFRIDSDAIVHLLPQVLQTNADAYFMRVGPDGSIYVPNYGTDTITKIAADDTVTGVWATLPTGSGPGDIVFDGNGNAYVSLLYGNSVAKITPDGTVNENWANLSNALWGLVMRSAGDLIVGNYGGMKISRITWQSAPTISSVTPNRGSTSGGTSITITGTDFRSGIEVFIGGAPCTDLVQLDQATLTCTTPANDPGDSVILLRNLDSGVARSTFTYVASATTTTTPTSTPTGELATTGSSEGQPLFVGGLLVAGGLLALTARRRMRSAA